MTPNEFRELALSFPEAIESAHMHHPDFRVAGKIFATLGYPNENSATVKLSPDEQKEFVRSCSGVFTTAKGAWGAREVRLFTCRPQQSTSCAKRSRQHGA